VVDRVVNNDSQASRIFQAVEGGLQLSDGQLVVVDADDDNKASRFSQKYYNPEFPDFMAPDMEPRTFSFNSPTRCLPSLYRSWH
jgi:excinuclease UvrABC ATPase subunit